MIGWQTMATMHNVFVHTKTLACFSLLVNSAFGIAQKVDVTHFVDVFRDDFNADGLADSAKWNVAHGLSDVNDELQYFRRKNVAVYEGCLHIKTDKLEHKNRSYTSGRVDTQGLFDFQFGEIEWRAKVPSGKGLWPALWLLHYQCDPAMPCAKWPTAVSVARGDNGNESVQQVTNWKYPQAKLRRMTESRNNTVGLQSDLSLDFHIYKLIWTSEELFWVIDDVEVFNVTGHQEVPSTRMQIVMSVAVGGIYAGNPTNETVFPTDFLIDYVVVRQPANITAAAERRQSSTLVFIMPLLVGLFGGIMALMCILGGVFCYRRRRMKFVKAAAAAQRRPSSNIIATSRSPLSSVYMSAYTADLRAMRDPVLQHYVRLLEIPPSSLTITQQLLGKGQYGFVWKGFVSKGIARNEEKTPVAVKTMVDAENAEQQKAFVEEMRIMNRTGRHLNIVNLVGISSFEHLVLILEYCSQGSLLSYLRSHRSAFTDLVDIHGNLPSARTALSGQVSEEEAPDILAGYVRVVTRSPSVGTIADDVISTHDLIKVAYQVSQGLEYLAQNSVIHRDLAARNILVTDGMVAKIADFGMARHRPLADYVLKNDQIPLPIKWMAPESILKKTFSYKSDVWSFGVLLWEIFSLGEVPYTAVSGSTFSGHVGDFVKGLSDGVRMQRPPYSPLEMYEIMLRCWEVQIDRRPTAETLRKELTATISSESVEYYLKLEEPYNIYNKMTRMEVETLPRRRTSDNSYYIMETPS